MKNAETEVQILRAPRRTNGLLDWTIGLVFGLVVLVSGYYGGMGISNAMGLSGGGSMAQGEILEPLRVDTPRKDLIPVSGHAQDGE